MKHNKCVCFSKMKWHISDSKKPEIYNKHGFNRHVFEFIQSYYSDTIFNDTDDMLYKFVDDNDIKTDSPSFLLQDQFKTISDIPDDEPFSPDQRLYISWAQQIYVPQEKKRLRW